MTSFMINKLKICSITFTMFTFCMPIRMHRLYQIQKVLGNL